jgi:hypothetical protein
MNMRSSRSLSRLVTTLTLALLIAAGGMLSSAPVSAQEPEAEAMALLEAASEAMLDLESFHFVFTTPTGSTLLESQVELTRVEGDLVRPDRFQAEFSVSLAFIRLTLSAVGIGTTLWVQDPLSGEDTYIQITGGPGQDENIPPLALLNPDVLVREALQQIENPEITGTEERDGQQLQQVEGQFDAASVIDFNGDGSEAEELDPLQVTFWIDEENRVVQMEFYGPLLPAEQGTGRIVRRVELSAFNEPVEIMEPAVSTSS